MAYEGGDLPPVPPASDPPQMSLQELADVDRQRAAQEKANPRVGQSEAALLSSDPHDAAISIYGNVIGDPGRKSNDILKEVFAGLGNKLDLSSALVKRITSDMYNIRRTQRMTPQMGQRLQESLTKDIIKSWLDNFFNYEPNSWDIEITAKSSSLFLLKLGVTYAFSYQN